ncbi:hypothetical protein GALMADRAFT_214931 [Galerina marginata CBS 339.88]|uniref:Uncharacterized protein n=1 Tax=Galerina marginata (strain CBS 339.88) TaxID=685588 RepID=A0A067SSU7_GALM3|nr:hypothetical protein GALMADRAFT_214931 [Galerina marginata CBS 339.88]
MQQPSGSVYAVPLYKGKLAHRSWPQLPEEIVRLITTHYLWDLSARSYCPQTWENRKQWYSRMVYSCIRDALDLEKYIMAICPEWRKAVETHLFWNQAINILDPHDILLFHMVIHPKPQLNASSNAQQAPIYLTHYQHLRNILNSTCLVCRINYPLSNSGLASAKRVITNTMLGTVAICREHDRRRTAFCGLCLRDSPLAHTQDTTSREYEITQSLGIHENEDDDTWPNVESTCRKCRTEWLWRAASQNEQDIEAIGGTAMSSADWETRQNVEGFIELAEGAIQDVITLAREKYWLRHCTKYHSLGQHLLAAHRTEPRTEAQEEEEEDSEEDRELMLMRGSGQVRDLALQDWARKRILDGHWFSPADTWYNHSIPGQPTVVPTVHPCPWSRELEGVDPSAEEERHPVPAIVRGKIPPSFALCEQAYVTHMKQMREILGPALKNIVRKLVMECSMMTDKGYDDPAQKARKMHIEEVVTILREEEGVWYDGVDWIEKKRNEEEALRRRRSEAAEAALRNAVAQDTRRRKEDDSSSTTSSSSGSNESVKSSVHGSSNATSPVLSTTTLQTTPSPPPLSEEGLAALKEEENAERQRMYAAVPRTIPVDPVRSTPRLLSKIPYVPVTTAHMPHYSMEALKAAWREACAPLYHCCCSICERAKVADINARAAYAASIAPTVVHSQPAPQATLRTTIYPQTAVRGVDAGEIELKEINEVDLDGEGEEEVEYEDDSGLEYDEEEEEDDEYDGSDRDYRYSASPELEVEHERDTRPRKRSSDELLDEDVATDDDGVSASHSPSLRRMDRREQEGTPPKRARIGDDRVLLRTIEDDYDGDQDQDQEDSTAHLQPATQLSAGRHRKRNSEELDDGEHLADQASNKRVRVDRSTELVASPRSVSSSGYGDSEVTYSPSLLAEELHHEGAGGEEEDRPYLPPRDGSGGRMKGMRKADMDKLIALEDVDE